LNILWKRIALHATFRKGGEKARRGEKTYAGYRKVGDELAIGSTLDPVAGTFSWLRGAGFLGTYDLIFLLKSEPGGGRKIPVRLTVKPKF